MADLRKSTDGPTIAEDSGWDTSTIPDFDTEFLSDEDLQAFAEALSAPEMGVEESMGGLQSPSLTGGLQSPSESFHAGFAEKGGRLGSVDSGSLRRGSSDLLGGIGGGRPRGSFAISDGGKVRDRMFITAQNDWAPVKPPTRSPRSKKEKGGKKRKGRKSSRKDETREGYLYTLLKWPLLVFVGAWVVGLGASYLLTRLYIWTYEYFVAWRGKRNQLRTKLYACKSYGDWVGMAGELDEFLGNEDWKGVDDYAYYDSKTVRRVYEQMRKFRRRIEVEERNGGAREGKSKSVEELKALIQACVKNNFVGVENSRLYSQTYYGTKNLVQDFVDEVEKGVNLLVETNQLDPEEKRVLFKGMHRNYGRTALCLSGGASFAYYHFGVVKALLDADMLPEVITGTSGGALVAALTATRTDEELKKCLVPALAKRITACREPFSVWGRRWWKTGARFDTLDWAKRCSWFTRGSMTFREAYERTGRILNVSCIPADPHSPTILTNYLTSPDCVIWSAVLASAAVPGIMNPVVLMMKTPSGNLVPYSFGHKWKDGSLRTDIPLKALNLHFNVNFSIVSQVNPHINLFFFSSRGSVGQPVTHRKGRGWRGGFIGSATEQYLKLDLGKWLRVIRHLELLPKLAGQDWSEIWLQHFSGTITLWPQTLISDFYYILSDPTMERMARMIHFGQLSAWPKVKFIANRMKVERMIERGRRETRRWGREDSDEDGLGGLLRGIEGADSAVETEGEGEGETTEGFATSGDEEGSVSVGIDEEVRGLLLGLGIKDGGSTDGSEKGKEVESVG